MARLPIITVLTLALFGAGGVAAEEPVLHVYNWSDYIADEVLAAIPDRDRHQGCV